MATTADLIAEIDANITPFKRKMSEAISVTRDTSSRVSSELGKIHSAFGSIRMAASGWQGMISTLSRLSIAGVGVGAGVKQIGAMADSLESIGKSADAIGITTDHFQELTYAMDRAGVAEAEQASLLEKFARTAHEAKQGTGALNDALERYSPAALASLKSSELLEDQVKAVAEAVRLASGEEQRATIITAAFGEANDELRRFLLGGAEGLDHAIGRARELGVAWDEGLIRKVPTIKEALRDIGVALEDTLEGVVANIALSLDRIFTPLTDQHMATLNRELGLIDQNIAKLKHSMQSGARIEFFDNLFGVDPEAKLRELEAQRKSVEGAILKAGFRASYEVMPEYKDTSSEPSKPETSASMQAELDRIHKEMLKVTGQTTEAIRFEHQKQLDDLKAKLDEGVIVYGDYVKAKAELETIATAKINEEVLKQIQPITNAISGELTRAFDNFVQRGELNFKQMAASMIAELAKVQFQMAIIQPLFGGGGTQGGGIVGSALASVFHEGGEVGAGGTTRSVPGMAFAMAPRFHNGGFPGLRANEVPAILERGEMVIPKGQAGRGGGTIVMNISTPDAQSFRRSEGQITAMLNRAVSRGNRNL